MVKALCKVLACLLFSISCFGTANTVYHEFTMNNIGGGCGIFISNLTPTSTDPVTIGFRIDFQTFTNQARIYYTTDGSAPTAAFGVPSGSTQVVTAAYFCTFNNGSGTVDVARGIIPALPAGTVVKYIVSAWHSSGGLEIFASGGTNTTWATATIFSYVVGSVLPISILDFSAKKENESIRLSWSAPQKINTSYYEIYASSNGIDFKNIGTKKASQNSNLTAQYFFSDLAPVMGNNFYKIKIVDADGLFSFTKVIAISFNQVSLLKIRVYGRMLHIGLAPAVNGNYFISLINNVGQRLMTWTIRESNSSAEYTFDLPQNLGKSICHVTVNGFLDISSDKSNTTFFSKSIFIQ